MFDRCWGYLFGRGAHLNHSNCKLLTRSGWQFRIQNWGDINQEYIAQSSESLSEHTLIHCYVLPVSLNPKKIEQQIAIVLAGVVVPIFSGAAVLPSGNHPYL